LLFRVCVHAMYEHSSVSGCKEPGRNRL